MEEFTSKQKRKIRDYFDDPNYPQPHGEIIAAQLLAAMIASGKYELEEYPRLVEASIKLAAILIIQLEKQMCELRGDDSPKPQASEPTNSDADYDPIPFLILATPAKGNCMNDPTTPEDNQQPSQAQKTREEIFQKRASRIKARAEFFKKIQEALAEPAQEAIVPEEKEIVIED